MTTTPFTKQLQGIRVLDLSRVLAGPHCTALLADLGAEVIKFEAPEVGDDSRHLGPFKDKESVYFGLINRGKSSVEIDFKKSSEREIFYQLVKDADVVVENFRPGVAARLGIDFETLRQRNPKIVYASISGFGQHGPFSHQPAYDIIAQAMSGLMSVTGFAQTGPTRSGESIGDLCAGVYAAWAISSALFARERHGATAQYIDVAMFDVLFSMQMTGLSSLLANGSAPGLVGNRHPVSTPFDTYRASDGQVVIAIASNRLFARLCECLKKPELASDPRFVDDQSRTTHESLLRGEIESWTQNKAVDQVCEILLEAGVPSSPVWDLAQAADSDHAAIRQLLIRTSDNNDLVAPQPVFFNGHKPHSTMSAPPLGRDNQTYGVRQNGGEL